MKYIRTKDKIIKVECVKEFNGTLYGFQYEKFSYRYENGKEIIAQADTIEELCDMYCYAIAHINKDFDERYSASINEHNKNWLLKGINNKEVRYCYGAIWTDKGLIYVAKMNSKGELELL